MCITGECTDLVLVNTGFYFVFWAKLAILSNRKKNQINVKMENGFPGFNVPTSYLVYKSKSILILGYCVGL